MGCFALELGHKDSQGLLEWCWFHNRLKGAMLHRLLILAGGCAGSSFKQSVTWRMTALSGVDVPGVPGGDTKCFLIPRWSSLPWRLCKVVVHSFPWHFCLVLRKEVLCLDSKGILERNYKPESSTKLRCSWWSILETNGQWTGLFLLFATSPFSYSVQRMEPRALYRRQVLSYRVTPFSESKHIYFQGALW